MTCDRTKDLLPAYADNELDALTSSELQRHLETCAGCFRAFESERAVKQVLSSPGLRYRASDELRRQMTRSVPAAKPSHSKGIIGLILPLLPYAAAACLVLGMFIWFSQSRENRLVAQSVLAAHLRSMQLGGHLMDVESTDQHTVKPWFDGKLDFAPPVRDLASDGFPLAGGRLDYLNGRSVAALIYHRNKHIINVFIWPGQSGTDADETIQGFNLAHWNSGGMTFWAVSDCSAGDLSRLAELIDSAAPAKQP